MRSLRHLSCVPVAMVMAVLTSCGAPGVPLPPSLKLPKQVTDLRAVRKGDKVYLAWTVPAQTTDLQNIQHFGVTRICRSLAPAMTACGNAVGEAPASPAPVSNPAKSKPGSATTKIQASYSDTLPPDLQAQNPTSQATYAVSVLNPEGRSAGLSNQVRVPAAPTLSPPADFRVQLTADGVGLSWGAITEQQTPGLGHILRIYRREEGTKTDTVAADVPLAGSSYVDKSFEWEKAYEYRMTVVTSVRVAGSPDLRVEGDDTPSVRVVATDVFPPAVPVGLQAVASGAGQPPFVDLIWAPAAEGDLAGYNLYRHEEGSAPAKINSGLAKTPAYRDAAVAPGKTYFYSVSAVDLRGNESGRSEEATEAVP